MSAIQELQSRLQNTNALIARYQESLSLPTTSAIEARALKINMRSLQSLANRLEVDFLELAATEKLEVYKYRLLTNTQMPSLAGIGDAWSRLQNLYVTIYNALTAGSKAEAGKTLTPELGFAYSFPGSVGVVVTLPPKPPGELFLTSSPTDEASKIVFDLIESKDIQAIAQKLGPLPIQAMNQWLEVHSQHHYGFAIEWRADNTVKRTFEVKEDEVAGLQAAVQNTKITQRTTFQGLLSKVDWKHKSFRLTSDIGEEIEGTYGEDVIKEEHAASVPSRYTARIATVTEMVYIGKKPKSEVILESLEPL